MSKKEVVMERHLASYFLAKNYLSEKGLKQKGKLSLMQIGLLIGKGHANIISSIKVISNMIDTDKSFVTEITELAGALSIKLGITIKI